MLFSNVLNIEKDLSANDVQTKSKKVDLVFVVDTGYTMKSVLANVKTGLKDIVDLLTEQGLDVRVCLIRMYDADENTMYGWNGEQWEEVNEKAPNFSSAGEVQLSKDGASIIHPDQVAVIDIDECVDNQWVENKIIDSSSYEEMISLGITMGEIDSFFPEEEQSVPVINILALLNPECSTKDFIVNSGTIPSRTSVEKFIIQFLSDKSIDELEQDERYLVSKSLTEIYMLLSFVKMGARGIELTIPLFTDGFMHITKGGGYIFGGVNGKKLGAVLAGTEESAIGLGEIIAGGVAVSADLEVAGTLCRRSGEAAYNDLKKLKGAGNTYSNVKNVGITYKGQGTVIDTNPLNEIKGIYKGNPKDPYHFVNRVIERNVDAQTVYNTFKNPQVILSKWNGQRYLYITEDAAVAVDSSGKLVTAWSRSDFGPMMEQILKEAH